MVFEDNILLFVIMSTGENIHLIARTPSHIGAIYECQG